MQSSQAKVDRPATGTERGRRREREREGEIGGERERERKWEDLVRRRREDEGRKVPIIHDG